MKYLILLTLIFSTFSASSQAKSVDISEVKKYVGDTVRTIGLVYSGKYFPGKKNAPTVLNLGAEFPNQLLTIVIPGSDRKNFNSLPKPLEEYYTGKTLMLTGKVILYKGNPQIVIRDYTAIEEITIEEMPGKK